MTRFFTLAWPLWLLLFVSQLATGAELIAQFRLEDNVWSGSVGELKDSAGFPGGPFDGQAIGATLPSPNQTNPAKAGNPGTCGFAGLPGPSNNGAAFTINGLPVSTAAGATTSVSFWMYWDGSNSVMPIGWNRHDLWFYAGNFGFNSGNGDLFGVSAAGLANGWHHVVAVFTNRSVTSNKLYIDGVVQSLLQRRNSPNNSVATVGSTLRVGGWQTDNNYRFSGALDEVKVFNGETNSAEVSGLYNEIHQCPAVAVAEWHMDESAWSGLPDEVIDTAGVYNATGMNGATTAANEPRGIPGNTGTCGYGVFDGVNDYVAMPNSFPNLTTDFTITAWIRTKRNNKSGQRIFIDDQTNSGGFGFSLGDGGTGKLRFYARGSSQIILDTPNIIRNDQWYFVAAVADISHGLRHIYVYDDTGNLISHVSTNFNGWGADNGAASIGGENNASSESGSGFKFDGNLDEVKIYSGVLDGGALGGMALTSHFCPVPPTLLGEYRFEEAAWNGTADELKDSSGNNRHGVAIGNNRPSSSVTNPARSGTPGTCAYASLPGPANNGAAFSISGLPVSTSAGAKTSVAFWMYWNGGNSVMPVGWQRHDLWLVSGNFGFNTGSSDVFGISSSGLANNWHHVVAIFTNQSVSSNKLYIDGVPQTLTQRQSSPANNYATVSSTLRVGGWQNDNNYRFSGFIDELRVYDGELSLVDVDAVYKASHPCTGGVVSVLPTGFNCVESGANPASGHLYTKVADTPFSVDVVALKPNGTVETQYAGDSDKPVTVELGYAQDASCANWIPANPAISQTLNFTATDHGRKPMAAITLSQAHPNLRCRVTDANLLPAIVGCSSDNFSLRPAAFAVSSSANADSSGSSATAIPVIKTGANFSLYAGAVPGYTLAPKLDISKLTPHSGAVTSGTLSGLFNAADSSSGIADGLFNYSEVGYFSLGVFGIYDDNFTAVDQAQGDCSDDFSNSPVAAGKYGCKFANTSPSAYFGRFIPDHFQTQVLSHGSFAHACSSFSYNGQDINYAPSSHPMLTVQAFNSASPAAITQNYSGAFMRLVASQFAMAAPTSDALQRGKDSSTLLQLTSVMATPSLTDNGHGNLTLILGNDKFTYQREANAMIAPFNNAVAITVNSVVDTDGVVAGSLPMVLQPAGENIRYGRINLTNAFGSELVDLSIGMLAEQYNGSSFVTNAEDKCSVATLSLSDPDGSDALQVGDTCIWDDAGLSGGFKCSASAPAGENFVSGAGLAAGSFNLNLKAPNKIGSLNVDAAVAGWLRFDWQGSGQANPSATATFGIYKGNSRQIYRREVY